MFRSLSESDTGTSAQPKLLEESAVGVVGYVDDVRLPENAKKGDESIRLFDTFGGDPAINGHQLDLVVANGAKSFAYELGLNVASVKTFEARIKRGGALGDAVEVSRTR